jgi:hypothetical protein
MDLPHVAQLRMQGTARRCAVAVIDVTAELLQRFQNPAALAAGLSICTSSDTNQVNTFCIFDMNLSEL